MDSSPTMITGHAGKDFGYMVVNDKDMFPGVLLGFVMMLVIESALFGWIFRPWVKAFPKCEAVPSPSHFLKFGTTSLAAMLFSGIVLTELFAGVDKSNTPLVTWYGYNNVCMFFDYPPSTYVMPTWWCIIACSLVLFAITDTTSLLQGPAGFKLKVVGTAVNVAFALIACFFSTCLAIGPDDDMPVHTTPFLFLIFAMPLVFIVQVLEMYARPRVPPHAKVSAIVAAGMTISWWLFGTLVILALSHKHVDATFGQTADILFMVFFGLAPIFIFSEGAAAAMLLKPKRFDADVVGVGKFQYADFSTEIKEDLYGKELPGTDKCIEQMIKANITKKTPYIPQADKHWLDTNCVLKVELNIDEELVKSFPTELRTGLLAKGKRYEGVLRCSSPARWALKLDNDGEEWNMFFATMRTNFFLSDCPKQLNIIGAAETGGWAALKQICRTPLSFFHFCKDYKDYMSKLEYESHSISRSRSSYVAHEVGEKAAAKFLISPKFELPNPLREKKTRCFGLLDEKEADAHQAQVSGFHSHVAESDWEYDMCIQFATDPVNHYYRDTTLTWESDILKIGTLKIPKQTVDPNTWLSDLLKDSPLAKAESPHTRLYFDPSKTPHQILGHVGKFRRALYPKYDAARQIAAVGNSTPVCPFSLATKGECPVKNFVEADTAVSVSCV